MTNDPSPTPLTEADQAYYNQLDEDVTAGRVPTIGHGTHRDGSRISDTDLDAILRGRPRTLPTPPGPPTRAHQRGSRRLHREARHHRKRRHPRRRRGIPRHRLNHTASAIHRPSHLSLCLKGLPPWPPTGTRTDPSNASTSTYETPDSVAPPSTLRLMP